MTKLWGDYGEVSHSVSMVSFAVTMDVGGSLRRFVP